MSDLPPPSTGTPNYLLGLLLIVVLVATAVAFVLLIPRMSPPGAGSAPAIGGYRSSSRCQENLRNISLAMQSYHSVYSSFPPTYTVDSEGKPLQSWRVLLLPYLGENPLYNAIRLDEPWDSEHNKQFHGRIVTCFECPSHPMIGGCAYSVVVGKDTAFEESGKAVTMGDLTDGAWSVLLVVERKTPLGCWMNPIHEITLEEAKKGIGVSVDGIGNPHLKPRHIAAANVLYADGMVSTLDATVTPTDLEPLLLRNDGRFVSRTYP